MDIMNAIVRSVSMKKEGGMLILNIWFERKDGFNQGIGGLVLYNSNQKEFSTFDVGAFLFRLLRICRTDDINGMNNKAVRIKADNNRIYSIGHILRDDWLDINE